MATVQNTLSMIVNNQLLINMMLLVSFLCRCDNDYFRNNSGDIKPDRARTHLWLQHINEHRVCMDNIDLPCLRWRCPGSTPTGSSSAASPASCWQSSSPPALQVTNIYNIYHISTISTIYLPYKNSFFQVGQRQRLADQERQIFGAETERQRHRSDIYTIYYLQLHLGDKV